MEIELKCTYCNNFYCNPVLLPCFHSLCYACAVNLQEKFTNNDQLTTLTRNKYVNKTNLLISSMSPQSSLSSTSSANIDNLSMTDLGSSIVSDLDKLSVFSEADSGVMLTANTQTIYSTSRPNSTYMSQYSPTLSQSSPSLPPTCPLYSTFLPCPSCNRMIYMDETGVDSLTKNTCLENIVEKYLDTKKMSIKCQMCPNQHDNKDAQVMCEQCEIYYCDACRESFHPMRGPLQKHNLIQPKLGRECLKQKNRAKESTCSDHSNELVNFYCLLCKCNCCNLCVTESVHINHQIMPLNQYCKSQKAELSQVLQSLSEKAKTSSEYLTKLKTLPDLIQENSSQIKEMVINEIDEMIRLLEIKKSELVDYLELEKVSKQNQIKDQCHTMSNKLQKTTGLLQFCVETLKEQDASSFLQISEHMIERVSQIDSKFSSDFEIKSFNDFDMDCFKLSNSETILREIKKLNYKQLRVPCTPCFIAEECINNNNNNNNTSNESAIILSWNQKTTQNSQGFILEIDDGTSQGVFKEVYRGNDTMCQINGLISNCVYNARVRAFNPAGLSEFSHVISIPSTPTLWFTFNPKTSHSDILFSNNFNSVTCKSSEDRVVLGSVGFSKGVHYWEVSIDRYDNQPDPAFGIARYDSSKDHMLGKDSKSWCMYIDSKRSWFMHNGKHFSRIDSGIQQGCVVGTLLDLNSRTMTFYVNDELHSEIAFKNLPNGVYYPAFSLNRNVQITLSSGLEPPPCFSSDSFSD